MNSIKILQYRGISVISRMIRWQTRSVYSHSAIMTPVGSVIEAWHKGGVQEVENISSLHTSGTIVDVYEFSAMYGVDETSMLQFAREQLGCGYDFAAILRFLSRRSYTQNNRWFCSELVAKAAERGGCPIVNLPAHQISPRDVAASPVLTKVDTFKCV